MLITEKFFLYSSKYGFKTLKIHTYNRKSRIVNWTAQLKWRYLCSWLIMAEGLGCLGCCNNFEGEDTGRSVNFGDSRSVTHYTNFEIWFQTGAASSVVNLFYDFEFLRLAPGKCGPAVTTFSALNHTYLEEVQRIFSLS